MCSVIIRSKTRETCQDENDNIEGKRIKLREVVSSYFPFHSLLILLVLVFVLDNS